MRAQIAGLTAACLVLSASAGFAAPVIRDPALAITKTTSTTLTFIPIAINGSGFGPQVGTSQVVVWNTTGGTTQTITATDASVVVWNDSRIVIKLPLSLDHPQGYVITAQGTSNTVVADRYVYDYFPTNSGAAQTPGTNPVPLAVANDGVGRGWILEEFQRDLKWWNLSTGLVTRLSIPKPPEPGFTAQTLFGNGRTNTSGAGESVLVDPIGRAWFSQGGSGGYPGPYGNHSRIGSYAVGPGFNIYSVPGNDNEVFGIAWDQTHNRIWFTQGPRQQCVGTFPYVTCVKPYPPKIVSFNPNAFGPANTFDFEAAASTLSCNGGSLGMSYGTCNGGSSDRLSCTTDANCPGGTCYLGANVLPTVGTCSNVPSRSCFNAHDCVLVDQICPANVGDDTGCFHEYPVTDSYSISHLAVTPSGDAVWYANYGPGDIYSNNLPKANIGRLDPTNGQIVRYPVHAPTNGFFYTGPWKMILGANGDPLFDEYTEHTVARLDSSRINDPACQTLTSPTNPNCATTPDATCKNPCIDERLIPGFDPGDELVHGIAEDVGGNLWFNQGGFTTDLKKAPSVGYWKADRSGLVLFPTFSLFPDSAGNNCFGTYTGYNGAEITVNRKTGEVWFADYCRKRIGRLRKIYCDCCS